MTRDWDNPRPGKIIPLNPKTGYGQKIDRWPFGGPHVAECCPDPKQTVNLRAWQPTSTLRILNRADGPHFQQGWRDQITGATEWRDVPVVEEE
jgi:hypothetical protein